ncbi:MAG: CBS domain-containing protein [Uliginosibacterium sp.]|nr:CBS domain-containing protein [Uliginosibacterium sp.]
MFVVYGISGQSFRGPMEGLSQVPGVAAARRVRGVEKEGEELGPEYRVETRADLDVAAPDARARAAYASMLPRVLDRGPVRHAWQVMGRDVLSLRTTDTVADAWRALTARGVRQAPVVDALNNVVGLVSDRDLLTVIDLVPLAPALGTPGGRVSGALDRSVAEVMVTPVVCADPVTDIRRIAHVLIETGLTALPVVNESQMLLGVVSRGDILRAAVADPPLSLWA